MTFDLDAARKEQQERNDLAALATIDTWKVIGLIDYKSADAQLTAALDEIERLQHDVLFQEFMLALGERDAARELADKSVAELKDAHRDLNGSKEPTSDAIRDYEAAKNPDGSWK